MEGEVIVAYEEIIYRIRHFAAEILARHILKVDVNNRQGALVDDANISW